MKSKFSIDLADEWVESHPDEYLMIDEVITQGLIEAADVSNEELVCRLYNQASKVFDSFSRATQQELMEDWDGDTDHIKQFLALVSWYKIQGFLDESKLP